MDEPKVTEGAEKAGRGRARTRRRPSLLFQVLAVLCAVALLPLTLMGYHLGQRLTEDLADALQEQQLDKGMSVASEIAEFAQNQFTRLQVVADSLGHGAVDSPETAARVRQILHDYVESSASASGSARPEGVLEIRLVPPDPSQPIIRGNAQAHDPEPVSEDVEPRVAEAVAKGRRGSHYLSNPFMPRTETFHPLAVLSVPLRPNPADPDGDRAVLIGVVSLARIQDIVAGGEGSENSAEYAAYVLDDTTSPEGEPTPRLFAHAQFSKVLQAADLRASPLVQDFMKNGILAHGTSSASMEFDLPASGDQPRRAMIGTYVPVEVPGHVWGVFVEVDREIAFDQVRAMRMTAIKWGILAVALAIVMGVVFSWRITKPIHELTESTRRVANGEYGKRVKVESNDEIGMLADNFNVMSEEVRQTIDDLVRQKELNDQLFISSIRSLAAAIDARDPYTRGHSERVTRYARTIARQLDLPPEQVRNIEVGALLHDVGKIGIEDRILRKPASLTPEEFEIMKTHPEKGGDIMEPIGTLRDVTEIIIHHHERWDGAGYPSGLKGEEIPLGARVVNVADTFDAMTTNRPYQRAMTFGVAAKKIGEFSGKACDPRVVKAFQAAMDAGLFGQVETEAKVG